ncbi:MAG TPA: ATP-dependent DNA ligase [Candidatus Sulfotelmatobacter sp.]|nr:ATP-dependent DNA ligase [Candidatus Sulfotelmatobacter sp.]
MPLPLKTGYEPMEAFPVRALPVGPAWQYEPKWDGFRCLAFRDGAHVDLMSKASKPLTRYFPELVSAIADLKPQHFVLDGEIVIPVDGQLSFDSLLMRIHPAASRVRKLSKETPAMLIVFDLLVDDRNNLLAETPLKARREKLEQFGQKYLKGNNSVRVSPATEDIQTARKWFHMGVALDGVVAKRRDLPYDSGERAGMQKIKKERTADCVIGGFRYLAKKPMVGSLLLGLYDGGKLDHVGFTSSIHDRNRAALTAKLKKLIKPPGFTGKAPGGPSRWSTKRSMEWEPLAPKLVVEVQFDHFTGGRFRHGTKFVRWRPDKAPEDCTTQQVKLENRSALDLL